MLAIFSATQNTACFRHGLVKRHKWRHRRSGWSAWAILLSLFLYSCGGGGGSSSASEAQASVSSAEEGVVLIGITDAPGDFVSYVVSVNSLTLTRSNGDVVETLPLATEVDFNELVEVTEFLTVATVPAGTYESAAITLDFSDAHILVQDELGDAVEAAVQDAQGAPLAEVTMSLQLTDSDVIRVQPDVPAAFSLDFDLNASNTIDLTSAPPVVTVEPFLLATPELETDREHRVRGVLQEVVIDSNEFTLQVRPFRHRTGQFGELVVGVEDATQYEVDGTGYTGEAGLAAMAELALDAPVVAFGGVSGEGLTAEIVIAGSSVPWSDADVVRGTVVARTEDLITVRGAALDLADGRRVFRGEFHVQLSENTSVTALGVDNADLSIASVSVGQPILA